MVDFSKEAVYVVHAKAGYEQHEKRLEALFPKMGLSLEWMTAGDPSLFSQELLDKYFVSDIEDVLSKGVLSCTLNHILIYEQMVSKGQSYALVFENDPFFLPSFDESFMRVLKEVTTLPEGFLVSLENSTLRFPSYWQTKKGQFLYKAKSGRMAGAYLIDFKGAQNALKDLEFKKCNTVIDWWHNDMIDRKVLDMYWAHPPMTEQGSHNGYMHAGISSKKNGILRRVTWYLQKAYKYFIGRLFNQSAILHDEVDFRMVRK